MKPMLTLSIPRPCDQKWDSFQQTTEGGYCSSCNKVVVDFTKMSDAEIVEYFKSNPAHTCGKFRTGQLKEHTASKMHTIQPGLPLLRAGVVSLLLLLVARPASAQEPSAKPDTVLIKDVKKHNTDKLRTKFTGTLVDETGYPLAGAHIWLKGTTIGTSADVDGKFEFPSALNPGDVLVFSFIGFRTKEVELKAGDVRGFQVPLAMCLEADIMGAVAVHALYQETSAFRKFVARIGKLF